MARSVDGRTAARADDEVEVEEAFVSDDGASEASELRPELIAELDELARAGALALQVDTAVANVLRQLRRLRSQAHDVGRYLRRLGQHATVGGDRGLLGSRLLELAGWVDLGAIFERRAGKEALEGATSLLDLADLACS